MTQKWNEARDTADVKRIERSQHAIFDARPKERSDIAAAAIAGLGLVLLITTGGIVAGVFDRNPIADPELLQPLPDRRILANLRDSDAPIVAATALGQDDVVVLRNDGRMAIIDQHTELLSDDQYPDQGNGLSTPPIAMDASCPNLTEAAETCSDPGALSVLSQGGGLIRGTERLSGLSWQVLLDDSAWIGQTGTPVDQSEVASWASTQSGARTVVLAGQQGLAVHDSRRGRWTVPVNQDDLLDAVAAGPVRLVADQDVVWIISQRGYGQINGTTLRWSQAKDMAISDLAITPDFQRIAITTGPCDTSHHPDCLTLSRLDGMDDLTRLVGEQKRFADLDQPILSHAMMQSGKIVTVGGTGVHAYDPKSRSWDILVPGRVDSFFAASDGRILAATGGQVHLVQDARLVWSQNVDGGPFRQLVLAGSLRLGLGEDGTIRNLATNTLLAGEEEPLAPGASFTTGASIGAVVLMAGPDGVLLHDVERRRFNWIAPAELSQATSLLQTGARLFALGDGFTLVNASRGIIENVTITGDWPSQEITTQKTSPSLRAPLRSMLSDGQTLSLVDATGRSWRFVRGQYPQPLVGDPMPDLGGTLRFATGHENVLITASDDNFAFYAPADRDWSAAGSSPNGSTFSDLHLGNSLFATTKDGMAHVLQDDTWQTLVGNTTPNIASSDLSDAADFDGEILFAGEGQLQAYDPVTGDFTRAFSGGSGPVRIVDTPSGTATRGQPLWVSGGKFMWGSEEIASDVRDAWAVSDGYVAERRGGALGTYVAWYPQPGSDPTCSYFAANSPTGTVRDGMALDANRMLVATSAGWGIHDAAQHRWISLQLPTLQLDERLLTASSAFVALSPTGFRALPQQSVALIDSCARPAMSLNWTDTMSGKAAAFNPATGKIGVLASDGSVTEWIDGASTQVQQPSGKAPDPSTFRAMAFDQSNLLFAAEDGVWSYNMTNRTWSQSAFPAQIGKISLISFADVSPAGATLSLWMDDGRSLQADYSGSETSLKTTALTPVRTPRIPLDPAALTDFSMNDGTWAFGADNQIAFGPPTDARLETILTLTEGETASPYNWGKTLAFLTGTPESPSGITIIPPGTGREELNTTSRQLGFRYQPGTDRGYGLGTDGATLWRIDGDGRLLSCDIKAGGTEQDCTQTLAPPLNLTAEDINFAWGNGVNSYIVVGNRLFTIDEDWRELTPVEGPTLTAESRFIRLIGKTLALDAPGGTLWTIEGDRATPVASEVSQLAQTGNRYAIAHAGQLLVLYANASTVSMRMPEGARAITYDWSRGVYSALSPEGLVLNDWGQPVSQIVPPAPDTITAVIRVFEREIYVQRANGIVEGLVIADCDVGPHGTATTPCYSSGKRLPVSDRGLGRLTGVEADAGRRSLRFERGTIDLDQDGTLADPADPVSPAAPDISVPRARDVTNTAGDYRSAIEMVDGRSVLAPVRINGRRLIARTREVALSEPPKAWNALDTGWMSWDRGTGQIVFDGISGPVPVAPAQAIVDGQIIASRSGRAMPLATSLPSGSYAWRNDRGLWHYRNGSLHPVLVAQGPRSAPDGQQGDLFLLPGGNAERATDGAAGQGQGTATARAGDLTVTANARAQSVEARISRIGGADLNAFSGNGFAHDLRSGLGYIDGRLMTVSPVGLIPAPGAFTGVEALPQGQLPLRILSDRGMTAELPGSAWVERQAPGVWTSGQTPLLPIDFGSTGGRQWSLTDAGLEVTAPEEWRRARDGLDFAYDHFLSVAGTRQQIVVATALGTQSAGGGVDLPRLGAPVGPVPSLPLVTHAQKPGQAAVYEASGQRREWDGTSSWIPVSGVPPWTERVAAVTPAMRVDLAGGRLQTSRQVTSPGGATRWFDITWRRNQRFPFDVARNILATPDALWIGTDMGLRRLGPDGQASSSLFDVANIAGQPAGIRRLGAPETDRGQVMAISTPGDCAVVTQQGLTATCPLGESLDRRFVLTSSLWSWVQTDAGPGGIYPTVTAGQQGHVPVKLTAGNRWLHDSLTAWAACKSGTSELWDGASILRQNGTNIVLPASADTGLHCQVAPSELGAGQRLASGLYVLGAEPLLSAQGGQLTQVPASQAPALAERANGEFAFDAGRIRLRIGQADGNWESRTAADTWRPLDWDGNLPAMDHTRGIALLDGSLVRVTPEGLISEDLLSSGLVLDPARFMPGVADRVGSLAECNPDRIVISDGSQHAIPARNIDRLVIQCRNGPKLMGEPAGTDIGALKTAPDGLYGNLTLIEEGGWFWTSEQTGDTGSPAIEAQFQGEVMPVAAGRFPIDSFTAIGAPFDGRIDLVTADGWRRYGSSLSLDGGARPKDVPEARAITAVTSDMSNAAGTSQTAGEMPVLCTTAPDGSTIRSSQGPLRRTEACMRWQGRAGVWSYRDRLGGGPEATAIAANGPTMQRKIGEGRYLDLLAIGTARAQDRSLIVPTRQGSLTMTREGTILAYYQFSDPRGLYLDPNGTGVAITGTAREPLDMAQAAPGACPALSTLLAVDGVILTGASVSDGVIQAKVFAQADYLPMAITADCTAVSAEHQRREQDVTDRARYQAQMRSLDQSTGIIRLQDSRDGRLVLSDGLGRAETLSPSGRPGKLVGLFPARDGRTILAVYQQELFLLDVDAALTRLAQVQPSARGGSPDAAGSEGTPNPDAPPAQPQRPMTTSPAPFSQPEPHPKAKPGNEAPSVPPARRVPSTAPTDTSPQTTKLKLPTQAVDEELPWARLTRNEVRVIQTALSAEGRQ